MPSRRLTTLTVVALLLGIAGGLASHYTSLPILQSIGALVGPLGSFWAAALQMTIIPLVVALLVSSVASGLKQVSRLGGFCFATFLGLMLLGALFTTTVGGLLIEQINLSGDAFAAIDDRTASETVSPTSRVTPTLDEWLGSLLPSNPVRAAADENILPLIIFVGLFGLAAARLEDRLRVPLVQFFEAVTATMLTMVKGVMWFAPLGVFGLTFPMAAEAGLSAAGYFGIFIVVVSGLLIAFTFIVYAVTAFGTGLPLGRLVKAMGPANAVAFSTRSSLASLPALFDGARRVLQLPADASGFALPVSASLFKINNIVSSTTKLLFVAHVFDVPLSGWQIATFLVYVVFLSLSTVGIPGGSAGTRTLPLYVAFGFPIEPVIVLEAVETIPDIFKTVLNVIGYMSITIFVSRYAAAWRPSLAAAAPAPAAAATAALAPADPAPSSPPID